MRKITAVCCLLLFTLAFGHRTFAQDTANAQQGAKAHETEKELPPVHYYHLNFVIEEFELRRQAREQPHVLNHRQH